MGNFQHLAQKVLSKNCLDTKVSCCTSLAEETGNFQGKSRNNSGNFDYQYHEKGQSTSGFNVETYKETCWKPESNNQETFAVNNNVKSFLRKNSTAAMLDGFFSNAVGLDIKLLPDDKRWLKTVCFGLSTKKLCIVLNQYIYTWKNAMEAEPKSHRKQNVGRKAANTQLREILTNNLI